MKEQEKYSEDIYDIISKPPSWLLRRGILLVLLVIVTIVLLAAFIRYPDIVQTSIRINATNAPKSVISRVSGNIVKLLVRENDWVEEGQDLGWLESTANHSDVIELRQKLEDIRHIQQEGIDKQNLMQNLPVHLTLGELQNAYQGFHQSFVNYKAAQDGGVYLKRKSYIDENIANIHKQREQLIVQQKNQREEYDLAEREFKRYEVLVDKKVISSSEFEQKKGAFIAKQYPLQQTQFSLLSNEELYTAKLKELTDLENQIREEKSNFMQALNSLISEIDRWKSQYILSAPLSGAIVFAGVIQENQHINIGQEIFYLNPGSTDFFGEISIPQYNMGKVKEGQKVLIKLNSYPFQEYGVLNGEIKYVNSVPVNDSIFHSQVLLQSANLHKSIILKPGMRGSAEIITQDMSLLSRFYRNMNLIVDFTN